MEFKKIISECDIQELMNEFAFFHDSCIKEIHYLSGSFVDEKRNMHPINSDRTVSIIFESQQSKSKTLELRFNKIKEFHLIPKTEDTDCVIYGASLKKINDFFYWADWVDFSLNDLSENFGTWIIAQSVCWQFI